MKKIKIYCFEGEWDRKHPELRVKPLLDVLEQAYIAANRKLTLNYKFCQSLKRLTENLEIDGRSLSKQVYNHCFYFAFHGDSEGVSSADGQEFISFAEIANSLNQRAAGGIVFFGSCGGRASKPELEKFRKITNARLVVGYASAVDWLDSSMFEMFFFSELCRYEKVGSFINKVRKTANQPLFSKLKVILAE